MSFNLSQTTERDEQGTYQLSHPVSFHVLGLADSH